MASRNRALGALRNKLQDAGYACVGIARLPVMGSELAVERWNRGESRLMVLETARGGAEVFQAVDVEAVLQMPAATA